MDPPPDNSVTRWIGDLKRGDDEAALHLWKRYFDRLTRVARKRMDAMPRRSRDEEDVALSVFDCLCRGASEGRFTQLQTRDDLWRLLVAITSKKVVDQFRHQGRQKRGDGEVRGHSIMGNANDGLPVGFDRFASQDPSPEFMAMMEERHEWLLMQLRDDSLRQVATLRLEGYANQEIAEQMDISLRSVERKLNLIRNEWTDLMESEDLPPQDD